ncbi:MAG: PEP-CTERM sorting domain-containing protein, partial [Cyanobacteria bacterium J06649_11]
MRKFNIIAAILGLGLGFAAAAPAANAANLIPQQEGEIRLTNPDLGVLDESQAIDTSDLGFSVTSLEFDFDDSQNVNYGLSRLFVDAKGTENDYGDG